MKKIKPIANSNHVTLKEKEGRVVTWYHTSKKSKMKHKI